MIDVTLLMDTSGCLIGIDASGHSGSAEAGKDIVCAAASSLLRTVSRTLEMEPSVRIEGIPEEEGKLHLRISLMKGCRRDWLCGVSAFTVVGLKDLASEYPDYCRVSLIKINSD